MYYLTGAAGFLGSTVAGMLAEQGIPFRALVLPGDPLASRLPEQAELVEGDLLDPADLDRFLEAGQQRERIVIHCAALISMSMGFEQKVYDVNVTGTANLIAACLKAGVRKVVYVSSVHALVELPHGQTMTEPDSFDPEQVVGAYAKTKAEAARLMLDAYRQQGLPVCLLYPSGITGPGDVSVGHFTQTIIDYMKGRLPAGVQGGYAFSDVRDVAQAVLSAVDKGVPGQGYIIASHYITVREIFRILHQRCGAKQVERMLPLWLLKPLLPLARAWYRVMGRKEVFSAYALHTLASNAAFSNQKARSELGYSPRSMEDTLVDTVRWLQEEGKI